MIEKQQSVILLTSQKRQCSKYKGINREPEEIQILVQGKSR